MDTNRLRYFCTIADCGSLARAAIVLGISPAALSKAMHQLALDTNLTLMRPQGRGIAITLEGQRFALKAREILAELESLVSFAQGPESDHNIINIGSFEVFSTYLLGPIARELGADSRVRMHELTPGKIERALVEQRIDFGLTYLPIATNDVEHLQIGQARSGIFGIKKKFEHIPIDQLPFVVPMEPMEGVPNKAQGLDGWLPSFGNRKVVHKVTMMESAIELARQGLAVAYLPEFVIKLHNECVKPGLQLELLKRLPKIEASHPVYLVKHIAEKEGAAMKKTAKVLRQLLH